MFGSISLEAATGLIFVFLLLSVLVTAVGEMIASLLSARAKCLWKGVAALLESSTDPASPEALWTARLYAHPIMRPLFPLETQGRETELGPKGKGPSYIPARSFALALLDITGVTSASVNDWQRKLQARLGSIPAGDAGAPDAARKVVEGLANEIAASLDGAKLKEDLEGVAAVLSAAGRAPAGGAGASPPSPGAQLTAIAGRIKGDTLGVLKQPLLSLAEDPKLPGLRKIIGLIPTAGVESAAVRNGLLGLLQRIQADPTALATAKRFADEVSASHARDALARLPNPDLKAALLTLLDEAQGDVRKLRTNVEAWFDHSMDRVQGWYKRKTVVIHLGIAAALAILMNIDALVVLRHLSADPALRQSLLAQAEYLEKNPNPVIAAQLVQAPAGQPEEAPPAPSTPAPAPGADTSGGPDVAAAAAAVEQVRGQLLALGLPIGWSLEAPPKAKPAASAGKPEIALVNEYRTPPDWGLLCHRDGAEWKSLGRTLQFHSLGWLISIIAASLGAPFWFDLLNKFMNIRGTGKPPEEPSAPPSPSPSSSGAH